ncbi:MAG: hypothetical protein WAU00_11015, partial [Caldilinea sp.]
MIAATLATASSHDGDNPPRNQAAAPTNSPHTAQEITHVRWIAPSEKDTATTALETRLWDAADQVRANSGLKAQEYSGPILGLIFLR